MRSSNFKSSEILRKSFLQHKESDDLSLRKWADLCNIDSSTLNLILSSKRLIPKKHLKNVGQSLNFDRLKQALFEQAYEADWLKQKGIRTRVVKTKTESYQEIEDIIDGDAILLKSWLHLALLEYTLCEGFQEDFQALAKIFLVQPKQIEIVLKDLENAGFLQRQDGKLTKKSKKMRIPTLRSREIIRHFHTQMLDKAKQHLNTKTDKDSFDNRLISGYTIAVDPKRIAEAKIILEKALIEASQVMADGTAQNVYQLQVQLFPLG